MDQDPHGAFGPTEDARDLLSRHLVDEPEDQGSTAIVGQPGERRCCGAHLVVADGHAFHIERIGHVGGGLEWRLRVAALPATTLGDGVASDLE
jgi:hypothetical protein